MTYDLDIAIILTFTSIDNMLVHSTSVDTDLLCFMCWYPTHWGKALFLFFNNKLNYHTKFYIVE